MYEVAINASRSMCMWDKLKLRMEYFVLVQTYHMGDKYICITELSGTSSLIFYNTVQMLQFSKMSFYMPRLKLPSRWPSKEIHYQWIR